MEAEADSKATRTSFLVTDPHTQSDPRLILLGGIQADELVASGHQILSAERIDCAQPRWGRAIWLPAVPRSAQLCDALLTPCVGTAGLAPSAKPHPVDLRSCWELQAARLMRPFFFNQEATEAISSPIWRRPPVSEVLHRK